jgi:hypothetical protein
MIFPAQGKKNHRRLSRGKEVQRSRKGDDPGEKGEDQPDPADKEGEGDSRKQGQSHTYSIEAQNPGKRVKEADEDHPKEESHQLNPGVELLEKSIPLGVVFGKKESLHQTGYGPKRAVQEKNSDFPVSQSRVRFIHRSSVAAKPWRQHHKSRPVGSFFPKNFPRRSVTATTAPTPKNPDKIYPRLEWNRPFFSHSPRL